MALKVLPVAVHRWVPSLATPPTAHMPPPRAGVGQACTWVGRGGEMGEAGLRKIVELWSPSLEEFDRQEVRFALEVHPTEIAFDYYAAERLLAPGVPVKLVRFAGGPLMLLATGALLGARVPHVFYLLAAMPPAFNLVVLARVYDVRPALTRLLVVGSTVPAVAVVALVSALR